MNGLNFLFFLNLFAKNEFIVHLLLGNENVNLKHAYDQQNSWKQIQLHKYWLLNALFAISLVTNIFDFWLWNLMEGESLFENSVKVITDFLINRESQKNLIIKKLRLTLRTRNVVSINSWKRKLLEFQFFISPEA